MNPNEMTKTQRDTERRQHQEVQDRRRPKIQRAVGHYLAGIVSDTELADMITGTILEDERLNAPIWGDAPNEGTFV